MKKYYYISVNKHFEDWIEAKNEDEAVKITLKGFEDEQVNIYVEDEDEAEDKPICCPTGDTSCPYFSATGRCTLSNPFVNCEAFYND